MMMQKQQDQLQANEATLMTEWRTCWQEKHAEYPCRIQTAVQKAGRWSWKKFCASQADSNQKTHEMQAYRKKRIPQARQAQMDAGDAKRSKTLKKRAFSLPQYSYNVHYTKLYQIQNRALSSFCFSPRLQSCLCCRSSLILRVCTLPRVHKNKDPGNALHITVQWRSGNLCLL